MSVMCVCVCLCVCVCVYVCVNLSGILLQLKYFMQRQITSSFFVLFHNIKKRGLYSLKTFSVGNTHVAQRSRSRVLFGFADCTKLL
jgi:hypothetical protein